MSGAHKLLLLFLSLAFIFSCESTKVLKNNNMLTMVTLEKTDMAGNSKLTIAQNKTLIQSKSRSGGDSSKMKFEDNTEEKVWNDITNIVSKLDLSQFESWPAPTEKRLYDGAKTTGIQLVVSGRTLTSLPFDEGEPPVQLKELYDYLENVVNQ